MSILRRVERELEERIRRFFAPSQEDCGREVLELQRAILDEITARMAPIGRGRRVFPFAYLEVHISVPSEEQRPVYALAFAEGDRLAADVRAALREAGADPPPGLRVVTALEEQRIPGGFQIVYRDKPPAAPPPEPQRATLTVTLGKAAPASYTFGPARVNIGRMAEVLDEQQRMVRRNQVAFLEGADAVSSTVSRAHAHIQWDAASGEYRLYDDHSAYGTNLFREGALLRVPSGAGRGVALRSGDEIYFGQARVRFELG